MKARIYEIKSSAAANAEVLRDEENDRFYWNDLKFQGFDIGDQIFFVNTHGGWAMYTTIGEKDIATTRTPEGQARFTYDGRDYGVDDPGDRFKNFIRFDVVQESPIEAGDEWTSLGSSEVNDLWLGDREVEASANRMQRIEQLKRIFRDGEGAKALEGIESKLGAPEPTGAIGVAVVDGGDWLDDAIKTVREHGHMALWWSKRPVGVETTMAQLRERIGTEGYFNLYYTVDRRARYRARVIDFATEVDYDAAKWSAGRNVAALQKNFSDYLGESNRGKVQSARIAFLVDRMERLDPEIPVSRFSFVNGPVGLTRDNMQPYTKMKNEPEWGNEVPTKLPSKTMTTRSEMAFTHEHRAILTAIKTKPFILLAGISGTGKSRLVRTLAYQTCSDPELRGDRPGNFALIMVKPNWHDPTEMLGYVSRIDGQPRYVVTEFLRFLVKAWQYPDVPFFLCLDEMNLAPVEHYFADYLSVVETRRVKDGKVISDAILSKANMDDPKVFENALDKLGLDGSPELKAQFLRDGITLPHNLVVMGTVNMDETTHSFSRKVLDRAMTFEMNHVDLKGGLEPEDKDWGYPETSLSPVLLLGDITRGGAIPVEFAERDEVLKWLEKLNDVLKGTPFKVAYRVRDEFLIYTYHNSLLANKEPHWLDMCLDELLVMKVLSRIEGDEGRVHNVLENLKALLPDTWVKSNEKLLEMQGKLAFGYTSYWS